MGPLDTAGVFLIKTIFELYIFIVILRLVLPWIKADYYDPLSQFVIKLTDPLILPLKSFIPKFSNIDLSILLLLTILSGFKITLLVFIQFKTFPNLFGLVLWLIGDLIEQGINLMFFAVLIVVVLSWVSPHSNHPVVILLHRLTGPYLGLFKKWIPPIAGFDISPIPALISLKLLSIILVYPILTIGINLAL